MPLIFDLCSPCDRTPASLCVCMAYCHLTLLETRSGEIKGMRRREREVVCRVNGDLRSQELRA